MQIFGIFFFQISCNAARAVRHEGAIKGYGAYQGLETAKGYTRNESTIRIALSEPLSLT